MDEFSMIFSFSILMFEGDVCPIVIDSILHVLFVEGVTILLRISENYRFI
jgi:hypothetical protein